MQRASEHRPHALIAGVAITVLLCLWGALESYGLESDFYRTNRDPYMVSAQFTRLGPVVASLPEGAEIGYITDAPRDGAIATAMFLSAQYVLAPRLLRKGAARQEWVLGNFTRPADFASVGRSQGLRIQQDFGNGVVLFRREP